MKTKKMCAMALAAIMVGTSCTRVDLDELGGGSSGGGSSNPSVRFWDGQVNDLNLRLQNYGKVQGGPGAFGYGEDSAVFERGDLIGIYMVDTISNAPFLNVLRANVAYKKVSGDTFLLATGTDSIRLPTAGMVKFFAYYPWDENTAWPDIAWSVADQSDQSKLDLLRASDNNTGVGFGKIQLGTDPTLPPQNVVLKFRHMLSKITIKIRSGDGANIDQNSIAQVTMGVIGGTGFPKGRVIWGDTVPLNATFHMDRADSDSANGGSTMAGGINLGGYMDYPDNHTKYGVISFFPATNRSKYTALVIPAHYGNKNIAIKLTEKGQVAEDFVARFPYVGESSQASPALQAGNKHYIVTATLRRGAVAFDDVTIADWDMIDGGDLWAQ
ncbi:hypothetical protein AGMMS4957_16720 [Bacteroidia bacterium]|nr:hypothetical protein AGMMS4957_16720 [Bacteroidia bacterium]